MHAAVFRRRSTDNIGEIGKDDERFELMIAIGPSTEDVERQVDLSER
jgi:hypothetical protein